MSTTAATRTLHPFTLPVILSGSFMGILDFFIVNVAIPSVRADLAANSAQVQFVVAGYALTYSIGLITGGRLGDIYGHRRMFAVGLGAFVVSSLACGLAPTAWSLVAFRLVQGACAALLTPQVLSILAINYTGAARAKAFAAFGATLGAAAVSGQLIGGLLVAADIAGLGWRSCFLINVPIGLVALALVRRVVPTSRSTTVRRVDYVGVGLATVGFAAIVVPLVLGRQLQWPWWTWVCLVASIPVLAAFVRYELSLRARGGSPLIEISLFGDRVFVVGLGIVLAFYSSLASFFLVLALFLQEGVGVSALVAGLLFAPLGLGFVLTSTFSGKIGARLGPNALALGAVVMAVSYPLLWWATAGQIHWVLLVFALVLNGLGEGLVMTLIISTVLARVAPEHAGSGSGVLATMQQFASSLGVALIGLIFFGLVGSGYSGAFHGALVYTTGLLVLVVVLVRFLPRRA